MFDYLSGKLVRVSAESATIDVNGVGYKLLITNSCHIKLPDTKSQVNFYVAFVVREFSHTLYGFLEEGERTLFEALLNISGIGPKTALAIISTLSFDDLTQALLIKDTQALCKVPGIGKKTAERLLIELKDTLPLLATLAPIAATKAPVSHDAISALVNLGYNQFVAQKAVKKVLDANAELSDLSQLITMSLKHV
ncbi:MAG: ruvA [Chlamydiia bacterium]|nr:ruvA [Chlamydiia bacterium]